MRICPKCREPKPPTEFYKTGAYCKPCMTIAAREQRANNPDSMRRANKKWRTANPDKMRAAQKHWRENNWAKNLADSNERVRRWKERHPEEARRGNIARVARYKQRHPERVKKTKRRSDQNRYQRNREQMLDRHHKYYEQNKTRILAANIRWAKEHIEETRAIQKAAQHRRRGALGRFRTKDIKQIFELQHGRCALCAADLLEQRFEIDHIIPVSKGGTHWPQNL